MTALGVNYEKFQAMRKASDILTGAVLLCIVALFIEQAFGSYWPGSYFSFLICCILFGVGGKLLKSGTCTNLFEVVQRLNRAAGGFY